MAGTQAAANALGPFSPPPHPEGTPRGLKVTLCEPPYDPTVLPTVGPVDC